MTFDDYRGLMILEPKLALKLMQCYSNNPHRSLFLPPSSILTPVNGDDCVVLQPVAEGEVDSVAAFRTLCNV